MAEAQVLVEEGKGDGSSLEYTVAKEGKGDGITHAASSRGAVPKRTNEALRGIVGLDTAYPARAPPSTVVAMTCSATSAPAATSAMFLRVSYVCDVLLLCCVQVCNVTEQRNGEQGQMFEPS